MLTTLAASSLNSSRQSSPASPPPSVVYVLPSEPPAVTHTPTPIPTQTATPTPRTSPTPTPNTFRPPRESLPSTGMPPAAPTPAPQSPANSVIVYITDTTFVGPHVAVALGGTVTWVNVGSAVHSATAIGPVRPFDTGGLAHGQSATVALPVPGTYAYTSAPDCIGSHSLTFECTGSFDVKVASASGT